MKTKLILALVGLAVVGGVFFFVTKDSDDKNAQRTSTSTTTTASTKQPASADLPKLTAQTVGKDADCSTYNFSELTKVWGVPFTDTDINKVSELSTSGGKLYSCSYNETNTGMGVTFSIEYREHPNVESAKQSMNETRSTENMVIRCIT
ncbi:hypothetical protein IPL68_06150 [Candidatus Saccharibacteria bacterium]|nr:MAG: hypothetical protein IPL68_06150 [Candidatus Saccharibacteria bacterium]